jgi:hypothetical protein
MKNLSLRVQPPAPIVPFPAPTFRAIPLEPYSKESALEGYDNACLVFLKGALSRAGPVYLQQCANEMQKAKSICLRAGVAF